MIFYNDNILPLIVMTDTYFDQLRYYSKLLLKDTLSGLNDYNPF
jgi:hypothetical protein